MKKLFSTIRSQLVAGFAVMIALLLVIAAVAAVSFQHMRQAQEELYDTAFRDVTRLVEVETNSNRIRITMLLMLQGGPDAQLQEWRDRIVRTRQENSEILAELGERHAPETLIGETLREYLELRKSYHETQEGQVIPAVLEGDFERARELSVGGIQDDRYSQLRTISASLIQQTTDAAGRYMRESKAATARARNYIFGIGGLSALVGLLLAVFLTGLVSKPLSALAVAANRIARGDLTVTVPQTERSDEIGELSRGFTRMVQALRQVNHEIREGVNVLASTSSEILAATSQIATGVSETASSVNETTSTLEEARQTANLVSDKARAVSEVSQNAARVSRDGRREVEDSIKEMDVIREHMETIGRSIARLHEHSQAIGDIIVTVNDLAEQSNLLAVNAAIEAAKAGESGKGFSVVAHEMKNLAVQSKQATSQVRSILSEIQQTANSTVMATERGHKVVEAGVARSESAGAAIREMTDSISAAAQAAMQIAASSSEQLVGMEQVATAMENITQASHQNAAGTKQAEESARSLHELGGRLRELVERYKL